MAPRSARSGRRFAVLSAALGAVVVIALLAFAGSREAVSADASLLATTTKPNVVMVLADDLDTRTLSRMVNLGLMPKLKGRVIDNGTQFTNSFVTTAWCCPTRATLLTGLYSHNHNVLTNSRPLGGIHRFNDTSTLATWLQQGGYRTGLVGKYLNNYGSNVDSSTPVDDVGYIPPGWNDWQALHDDAGDGVRAFQMYNYSVNDNGRMVAYGTAATDYQTDVVARRAQQFIVESDAYNDARPFFLLVTPTAPHLEMPSPVMSGCTGSMWSETIRPAPRHIGTLPATVQLPQPANFNEPDLRDKPSWFQQIPSLTTQDLSCLRRQYRDRLTALRAIDDLVGRLFDTLQAKGELANTVFIFTSDNGFFLGNHRLTDKVLGYEESIRVPLYIRAPGFPPQVTTRTALSNDWAPTVAAFAGVTPGLVPDGRSLLPVLRNRWESNWRKRFLVEYLGTAEMQNEPPRAPFTAVRSTELSSATPANQIYVQWMDGLGSREFYNLPADPYQVSSQHNNSNWASVRNTMAGWLSQLRTCRGAGCQQLENQ